LREVGTTLHVLQHWQVWPTFVGAASHSRSSLQLPTPSTPGRAAATHATTNTIARIVSQFERRLIFELIFR
jgi:hypothetical protein